MLTSTCPASWNHTKPCPLTVLPPCAHAPSYPRRNGGAPGRAASHWGRQCASSQCFAGSAPALRVTCSPRLLHTWQPLPRILRFQACRCLLSSSNREFAYVLPGSCCSWVFSQKRRRNCPLCSAARIWSKIGVVVPAWTSAHPSGSVSLWTSPLWGLLSAEYPFPSFFPSVISTVMVKRIFVLIAKRKEHRQRTEGRGRGKKGKRKLPPWNTPLPATPSVSVHWWPHAGSAEKCSDAGNAENHAGNSHVLLTQL